MKRAPCSRFAAALRSLLLPACMLVASAAAAYDDDPNFWLVTEREAWTRVHATASSGDVLYVGGTFDYIGRRTGSSVLVDPTTGALVPGWPMTNGTVNTFATDGAGGWFLGGTFTEVGGFARTNLAHVRADMTVDPWNPGADGYVKTLVRSGGTLYVLGDFTQVGGVPHRAIAAIDVASGAVTAWKPDLPPCLLMAVAVSGSTVYLGGSFEMAGSQYRYGAAAFDAVTGAPRAWNAGLSPGAWVYSIALDGGSAYLSGTFTTAGGQARNGLACVDAVTGAVSSWNHGVTGTGAVITLQWSAGRLYALGNFLQIDGVDRAGIAAFERATGNLSSWYPASCHRIASILVQGGRVYVGGQFKTAGPTPRAGVAAFDEATAAVTAWDPRPNYGAGVFATDGDRILFGGAFSSIGGLARRSLAALDVRTNEWTSWNPEGEKTQVSAIAVGGDRVYVAGDYQLPDGTYQPQIRALDAATGTHVYWQTETNGLGALEGPVLKLVNDRLYFGGAFTNVGGQPRSNIAALDAATGAVLPWAPSIEQFGYYGEVKDLEEYLGVVYVVGNFNMAGGLYRAGAVAFDRNSGLPTSWDPLIRFYAPTRVQQINGLIYLLGDISEIAGRQQYGLVAVNPTTGALASWGTASEVFGATSMQLVGNQIYVAGIQNFMTAVDLETGLPSGWHPQLASGGIRTMTIVNGSAYLGGGFEDVRQPRAPQVGLRRVPLPVPGPEAPVVQVLSPNGGEAVFTYEPITIRWSATHSVGVQSVDLFLSRVGPTGPWEQIATGLPNTGSWTWLAEGEPSNYDAFVYVVAHDATGAAGRDRNDGGFAITTSPVPTLVELFRLEDTTDGVTLRWVADERASFTPQRGASATGIWTELAEAVAVNGREHVVVDRGVETGATVWYRLAGTSADGRPAFVAPLSIRHAGVTNFSLDPVAPNPARDASQVSYSLPATLRVRVTLVDVQGRTVASLFEGDRVAGRHVARLEVGDLPAGLYFLRLNAGGAELRRRVVVVH